MSRATKKHLGPHKYLRIKYRRKDGTDYVVFKCQIPHCSSHKPAALLVGDLCECWKCGKAFQMGKATLTLRKPHCIMCTGVSPRVKKPVELKQVEENLDKLLGGGLDDLLGGS